jgi:uncharacterized protein involved in exopolysaccharide biosynthesis/Mrp family chromosome partitioning ATPase
MSEREKQRQPGHGPGDEAERAEGDAGTGGGDAGLAMPFDIRAVLLGAARRWRVVALPVAVFAGLSLVVALLPTWREYEAATVLLFKPRILTGLQKEEYVVPPLQTQVDMVKMAANLEETLRQLGLTATLAALGGAVEAVVQKNTDLLAIRVRWNTAEKAAAIANTLARVFLVSQRDLRRVDAQRQVKDQGERLARVRKRLEQADQALQEYTRRNRVVDLDKEANRYLEHLTSVEQLLDQAKGEQRMVEQQAANIQRIIRELQQRVSQETVSMTEMEGVTNVSTRIERLRTAINDDKEFRARQSELAQRELAVKIAGDLRAVGGISESEYQRTVSEYERVKALAVDTEQTKAWRDEIKKLEKVVIPVDGSRAPSASVLRDIMVKDFTIQIDRVSIGEKVKQMQEAYSRVKERLDNFPQLQRDFLVLKREVSALEIEKKNIEDALAAFQGVADSDTPDFLVVSAAEPPPFPLKSRRKLIVLALPVLGLVLGVGLALGLEFADTTLRSGTDGALRLGLPLVGALPAAASIWPRPGTEDAELADRFRTIARRLRRLAPQGGARLVVASAQAGEGAAAVAVHLAVRLGRSGERVLLVDAAGALGRAGGSGANTPAASAPPEWLRAAGRAGGWLARFAAPRGDRIAGGEASETDSVAWLLAEAGQAREGLAEATADAGGLAGRILPERLPGVDCVPAGRCGLDPDVAGSLRLQRQLTDVAARYDLTLVVGPPLLGAAGAAVGQWGDGLLLVARSRSLPAGRLRAALQQVRELDAPAIGVIVTGVEPRDFDGA